MIVVAGAGGFIGGHLVKYLRECYCGLIRAVDKKPLSQWYQVGAETPSVSASLSPRVQSLCLDLSDPKSCQRACEGATEVYQLAADMGGIGFIEHYRVACMRSVLINVHMLEAACRAGVQRYFYSSSACVYNTQLQQDPNVRALKESDAYPAMAERGYGWEKLYSEMLCQEYWAERELETHIARFHNCYGPHGAWNDGREKAPAAICRKVIEAVRSNGAVTIWGDGSKTRSFMYIDDCVRGIEKIMHEDRFIAKPVNLGSTEMVTINELVTLAEEFAGVQLERKYDMSAPQGVGGRNSDNTLIRDTLGWEPSIPLKNGLGATYDWICERMGGSA